MDQNGQKMDQTRPIETTRGKALEPRLRRENHFQIEHDGIFSNANLIINKSTTLRFPILRKTLGEKREIVGIVRI